MSVDTIALWHKRARPTPSDADLNVQLGCHVEEFAEMLESVILDGFNTNPLVDALTALSMGLKKGAVTLERAHRVALLDSLCDQIVTAVGVAHCAQMNIVDGLRLVNASNWSKFDEHGMPVRDEHGKIAKGPKYQAPDLTDYV